MVANRQPETNCMSAKPFVDTNIVLYAYDKAAGVRHETARLLVQALWQMGGGVLSVQVLQEFYVNVTRKVRQPLSPAAARGILRNYGVWHVEQARCEAVLRASEIQERYQIAFWDALIVVTAVQGGADIWLSEDLNAGQMIKGVRVINPINSDNPTINRLIGDQVSEARAAYSVKRNH